MRSKTTFTRNIFPAHSFLNDAKWLRADASQPHSGLTIVELLVALILISLAILGAVSLVNIGFLGLRKSEANYDVQNLIDRNISEIESAADRYICAGTTCSISNTIPAKNGYVTAASGVAWNSFVDRCVQVDYPDSNGSEDLITPLVNYINGNIGTPSGLYREIQVHASGSTGSVGIGRIKHMTVQYRRLDSAGLVLRNSTIIPTIVAYCP